MFLVSGLAPLEADVEILPWMVVDAGVTIVTVAVVVVEGTVGPGCASIQVPMVSVTFACSQRWPWKPGRH